MKVKKQIFTILGIIIFTILSCGEDKSGTTKKHVIEKENKIESQKAKINTLDTFNSYNYPDFVDKTIYTKELDLFWIRDLEENGNKKGSFISLSDIYPLSYHPDSLAIPNLENVDEYNLQYFKLNKTYRKRFLLKTNISETDSVFIYDYSTDALLSFPVSKLSVVAYLNDYMDIQDCPCSQSDYMFGFEISKKYLLGLGKYFSEALVFIGKENPFIKGQMKAIIWKKIEPGKFPLAKSNLIQRKKEYKLKNKLKGQVYLFETKTHQIFLQDFEDYTDTNNLIRVPKRHLIIIDKQSGNMVNEMTFNDTESTSVTPLNFGINNTNYPNLKEQWVGKLFKDKSEVIFGFEGVTFGCSTILFIDSQSKYVQINCDNRH